MAGTFELGMSSTTPTHDVKCETDESVVGSQRQENLVYQQDVLEIVYHAFSIQEVHCRREPIPVQGLGEAEILLATGDVGDRDYFLERNNLNGSDQANNVYMTRKHSNKEARDHDEGPYCSCDEGLLLLLVLGLRGFLKLMKN